MSTGWIHTKRKNRKSRSQEKKHLQEAFSLEKIIQHLKSLYGEKITNSKRFAELIKQTILAIPTLRKAEYQASFLHSLIKQSKNTVFGKKFNFDLIQTFSDFQKQVPTFSYEQFKPYIERMMKGEAHISFPRKIDRFATSSGTGGTQKYIPVNKTNLKSSHFRGGMDSLRYYLQRFALIRLYFICRIVRVVCSYPFPIEFKWRGFF